MVTVESVCRYMSGFQILKYVILCVCVCESVVPSSCVFSPGGPVLHPDRQNTECLVIKEQKNAAHTAPAYHIIADRQREDGCRPVGLHCSWGEQSYMARLLMVKVEMARWEEQQKGAITS